MFSLNYTFWLNLVFGALALYLWRLSAANPMEHGCHAEPGLHHHHHAGAE
jgi:hypothetical protein